MCSSLRRLTKAVKRSRLMWPMGSTSTFILAGAMGMKGSRVMMAKGAGTCRGAPVCREVCFGAVGVGRVEHSAFVVIDRYVRCREHS